MMTFHNKTFLISGGTCTFGNAVLNRFLNTDIAEFRIFSCNEKKKHDMRLAAITESERATLGHEDIGL
jgi:UDP-N-acetylglucosamine 4,6-dehydratase